MNGVIISMCLSISFNLMMLAYLTYIENQYYDIVYELIRVRGVIWKSKKMAYALIYK